MKRRIMEKIDMKNGHVGGGSMERKEMSMRNKRTGTELKTFHDFLKEEDGMGTVELILIIVVLIGLVIIFKTQLRNLVESIFEKITSDSNSVMS